MMITRFLRFVHKHSSKHLIALLAVSALLTVGACSWLDEYEEEENTPQPVKSSLAPTPAPAVASAAAPMPVPTPATPQEAAAELAKQAVASAPPKEEYAPASRIGQDQTPPANSNGYAPPTQIGEQATSKAVVVKVALLIPMTGDSPDLGKSLLDAAVLAVYDKYSSLAAHEITARVQLLPKDTGDTAEGAEKAAQDAIQEGATLILGPVYSKQVAVVASSARAKNIPVITFSNNMAIASDGVYLFGFIPEQQVVRIVQYALTHNVTNIAALVPSNPYGAAIVKQLSAEVRKQNGRVHPVEYYAENMSALDNNVGRLARFLQDEQPKGQSLFIAEGGEKLKILTDTLVANGINTGTNSGTLQLLGTGLWDDPSITKWAALYGGWFASSPPEKYREFERHFLSTYSYKPERRASLSYDAVALAINIALASKGQGFPKEMIVDPVGFNGPANGIFRFHEDGSIERGLSILQVTPAGFKTIDPAPAIFNQ